MSVMTGDEHIFPWHKPSKETFRIGDRVEYIGDLSQWLLGLTGTVEKIETYNILVKFKHRAYGVMPYNLKKVGIIPEELFEL